MERKFDLVLLSIIIVLVLISAIRLQLIVSNTGTTQHQLTGVHNLETGLATLSSTPQVTSSVTSSEIVSSNNPVQSNVFLNEKFIPGTIKTSNGAVEGCSAEDSISFPHIYWTCTYVFFACIPTPHIVGGYSARFSQFTSLVGYLGFPESDSINTACSYGDTINGISYSNLFSGITGEANPTSLQLCLPESSTSIGGVTNEPTYYPNFINWSLSTIHNYTGSSPSGGPYYYAINNSVRVNSNTGAAVSPSGTTLILPAVSCGSTFLNNYLPYVSMSSGGSIPAIMSLSGFTPSTGLASDSASTDLLYWLGGTSWMQSLSSLDVPVLEGELPASFTYYIAKAFNYAKFPAGNKGDVQYLNTSGFFGTLINSSYDSLSSNSQGFSAEVFAGDSEVASFYTKSYQKRFASNILQLVTSGELTADTYSLPNVQSAYYPTLTTYPPGSDVTVEMFKEDGVFPFCSWNTQTNGIQQNCTFEDTQSINPISYYRLWQSTTQNGLDVQPFAPGNDSSSTLNTFTNGAMDSFCFYGESFNTTTGVYTSPSFTRIIPPTIYENYTSAAGECNGLFNNTNCFSPDYSSYMNFKDGIFSNKVSCTPDGINASIKDAWISSIYIANNGGNFCGYFDGQKNITDPTANSTMFLQNISTACPSFNSNGSDASLVITVKNVGNANITRPYLVVLFGNSNVSSAFYASNGGQDSAYNVYEEFLNEMETQTNGIIDVRYNNLLNTDMFFYKPGSILNPIPLQSLFQLNQDYLAGPYNNSLLGLWMYAPSVSTGPVNSNVIRTSNAFLSHSSSDNSGVPLIAPGGTATFTIEVPVSVLSKLISKKENISVYFGNTFKVSWLTSGSGPQDKIGVSMPVDPLVASGTVYSNLTHNNEFIDPSSNNPSPLSQYMVSYNMNLIKGAFKSISIYSDSLNISIGEQSVQNKLNVSVLPSVNVTNGSGSYSFNINSGSSIAEKNWLSGSSISCFASQDNINDFSVFWSTQKVSPYNLRYAVSSFYQTNSNVDNVLINRWRGLLFMPYTDSVVLNYNNIPVYPISSVSMQLESPSINGTSNNLFTKEAFVYISKGDEPTIYNSISSLYTSLSSAPLQSTSTVPTSLYGATMFVSNVRGNNSVIKIVGTRTLINSSTFSDKSVTLSVSGCNALNLVSNGSGVVSVSSSDSPCMTSSSVNYKDLVISSTYGPFYAKLYNSSDLNMSDTEANGVYFVGSNLSSSTNNGGVYTAYINISASMSNGFTLLFGLPPQTQILTNSKVYLYYANETPFNCNIVDTLNSQPYNLSSASEIRPGYYNAPNGSIFCALDAPFTGVRAVFMNASDGQYLISGDIGLGTTVQNMTGKSLMITYNGLPLNSQNVSLYEISADSSGYSYTNCLGDVVVTDGIFNHSSSKCAITPGGNYSLTFTLTSNGQSISETDALLNLQRAKPGKFIRISPVAVADTPSNAYNLSFNASKDSFPLTFTFNTEGQCNSIRILGDSPYPFAEIPYQVLSSSGSTCTYSVIANSSEAYNGDSYIIFGGENPSPFTYPDNWINVSSNPYSVSISTGVYNTTLLGNCRASVGPCIENLYMNGGASIGDLLVNNVSASQANIAEVSSGPISDCFEVSYSASQHIVWNENFSGIEYNSNSAYQVTNPSQVVSSTYCFFKDSSLITDTILSSGSPLSFQVADNLVSNFSYAENNNGDTLYVPPPKFVGYSSFSKIYEGKQQLNVSNYTGININYSCFPNMSSSNSQNSAKGITLPSSVYNSSGDYNNVYCILDGRPTYTSQAGAENNSYTTTSGETVNLIYRPGIYNISTTDPNGTTVNETLYADCSLTKNITSTVTQLSGGSKLYVLAWPRVYVNNSWVNYDPNNPGEYSLANYTALVSTGSGLAPGTGIPGGVIYSTPGISLINSCPANYTIGSMTYCTKPTPTVISAGSYDTLEGIPTVGSFGGGCYIGNLGSYSFSCMPTNGSLKFNNLPTSVTSDTSSAEYRVLYYNSSGAPVTKLDVSFDCNGWVYAANSTSGAISYKNTTVSCSDGNSGTFCSSNVETTSLSSPVTPNSYGLTATCSEASYSDPSYPYVVSEAMTIDVNSISAQQSEQTGLLANFTCGNLTDIIANNVNNNIADWTSFTKSIYNPITSSYSTLPEVGGCEIGRDTLNLSSPTVSQTISGGTYTETYSCPSGYTGTIESCVSLPTSLSMKINTNPSCLSENYTEITSYTTYTQQNGNSTNGAVPTGCNGFSGSGYTQPTVSDGCMADHFGLFNSTQSSFVLQYSNTSSSAELGVGIGVLNSALVTNITIPQSGSSTKIKDQYMSGLSVSQKEFTNMITHIYPTNILLSNVMSVALSEASMYPFDMLNILMLQNKYLKISGIPGFVNGSAYDYAMNIFTGGTSKNCVSGSPDYGLFSIGEGELCSGQSLPQSYSSGVFIPLGTLAEGLHSVQFYSVSENGNTSSPSVNLFDTVGSATNLNSACSNGNSRVFTSTYKGSGSWAISLSSDEECNSINNQLYGYVVNCILQTPSNETYTTSSKYYLAYNLPTIWDVSYSLLVTPKTYDIIPVQIYQVPSDFGTYLSLYHFETTVFAENNLPNGIEWNVTYYGITKTSTSDSISFLSPKGEHSFSVPTIENSSSSCKSTYTPSPSSGNLLAGNTLQITFKANTVCTTTFYETGLLGGDNWKVTYDGIVGSNDSPYIMITSPSGNYKFSVSSQGRYIPSPGVGNLNAGKTQHITFRIPTSTQTAFYETGLPSGASWWVKFNGINSTSTSSYDIITSAQSQSGNSYAFTVGEGVNYTCQYINNQYLVVNNIYDPVPSSGTATVGGSVSISYTYSHQERTNSICRFST